MASEDDDVFSQIVKDALPGKMITNFIVVAEILDENTEHLSMFTSDRMTPWLAKGMLNSAIDMVSDAEDFAGFDDEEDE